jgi:hypothetical protein
VTTPGAVVTGLMNDTPGYFVVSAVNATGESANSSQASATPTAFIAGLTATAANGHVQLQWNAHVGATAYNMKRALVSGGPYTTIANNLAATSFTDSTVGTCQTYYYVVTMTTGGGESAPSSEASAIVPGPLPPGFTSADIGAVGLPGSASFCNGQYTITGSGADIWNNADACQFVYTNNPLSINCDIRARAVSVQNTASNAKAAVMIRETLDPGSRQALVDMEPGGSIEFLFRTNTAGPTYAASASGQSGPNWVRLTRNNNVFSAYWSPDGTTWNQIGASTNIPMTSISAYVGLAVCAHNNSALNTSVLDNVTIGFQPPVPAGLHIIP